MRVHHHDDYGMMVMWAGVNVDLLHAFLSRGTGDFRPTMSELYREERGGGG